MRLMLMNMEKSAFPRYKGGCPLSVALVSMLAGASLQGRDARHFAVAATSAEVSLGLQKSFPIIRT